MPHRKQTVSKYIRERQMLERRIDPDFAALIESLLKACRLIAATTSKGMLGNYDGANISTNVQGEEQKPLDVLSNDIIIKHCEPGGQLCGMVSEEMDEPYRIPQCYPRGNYMLIFDPLDGSSNIDINMTVGTIFSILRAPEGVTDPTAEDFLQPGIRQVAAGYALYGPASMLVMTLGSGVQGFTWDADVNNFVLTHCNLRIPETAREFAINASNERFWEPPVRRYVDECRQGKAGLRGVDFNMRWFGSLVAEVHRILIRGGVFMYPRDSKEPSKPGRLRLMYEANPVALLVEQAGGAASTGRERLLELEPQHLHQRVPVMLGAKSEVERLVRYHQAFDRGDDVAFETPLFHNRSLFRTA